MEYKVKLTNRNYLVPVSDAGKPALINTGDGKHFLLAFTDEEEFQKLKIGDVRPELFSYERLKSIVVDDPDLLSGIIIDPFGKKIVLNHEAIEKIDKMSQGMSVRRATHSGRIRFWQPKQFPAGMKETAGEYFVQQEAVRAAWLFLLQEEGEPEPHWVMLLDFIGDRKLVFPAAARMMKPFMKAGEKFELMKAEGELGDFARAKGEPIYLGRPGKEPVLN